MGRYEEQDSEFSVCEQYVGELVAYDIDGLHIPIAALTDHLRRKSEDIAKINPRTFEMLVAAIFRDHFDCRVELTKQTRDGGKDLVCIDTDGGKFYVELKRYSEQNKVGIAVVQRFVGVLYENSIQKGVIVTSSTFTAPAQQVAEKVNDQHGIISLHLRDFHDLFAWLGLLGRHHDDEFCKMIGNLLPPQFAGVTFKSAE